MAIRLKKKKNLAKQTKEIAETLLDDAQKSLRQRDKTEGVHNARKRFKQLRGLLRLIRFGIGEKIYDRENTSLRDAGRPLSEVRDADVMIESLDGLLKHFKDQVKKGSVKNIRSGLVKRRTRIRKRILQKEKASAKVFNLIKQIQNRNKKWPAFPDRFGILKKGIRRIYARGQMEMDAAMKDPSDENLHAWRKSVKYLRYQLEFLQEMEKTVIGDMAIQAHSLTDMLGFDHDLAVLEGLLYTELKNTGTTKERQLLSKLIGQRRTELQKQAKETGPHLYAETAKQFCKRLKDYWDAWQLAA